MLFRSWTEASAYCPGRLDRSQFGEFLSRLRSCRHESRAALALTAHVTPFFARKLCTPSRFGRDHRMHGAKLRCVTLTTRRERPLGALANHNDDTPRQTLFAAAAKYMLRGGVHRWRTRSTRTTAHPRSKAISPERRPSTHRVDGCRATALRYLQKAGGPPGRRPALSGLGRPSWMRQNLGCSPFYGTFAM